MTRLFAVLAVAALAQACGGPKPASTAPSAPSASSATPPSASGDPAPPAARADAPIQIASGDFHTCALVGDGTVRCWGRNAEGELGDGTTENRAKPVAVKGVTGAKQLAMAAHSTCALLGDGTVSCWGGGRAWGDEQQHDKMPPTPVKGIANAAAIDGGGLLYCALLKTGAVKCWGDEAGQRASKSRPPEKDARDLSVAEAHACALVGGDAVCWGDSYWGGSKKESFVKTALKGATQISTGDAMVCALSDGGVSCFGRNEQGELGKAPDMDFHFAPEPVASIAGAKRVVAGEAHACAILSDGTARCWGSNGDGELGRGVQGEPGLPAPLGAATSGGSGDARGPLGGIEEIALGADHGCARTKDGSVYCWGANPQGQLGDGTTQNRLIPTLVAW